MNDLLKKQPLMLFDGECGFCNKSIQFFLKHEKGKRVYFAPVQSEIGKKMRAYFEIDKNVDSLILIKNNEAYIKSCAAIRLTRYMKGLFPLLLVFLIIPPFIRNFFYDFIAKRRMKLIGRVESCALLAKEDQSRFLLD